MANKNKSKFEGRWISNVAKSFGRVIPKAFSFSFPNYSSSVFNIKTSLSESGEYSDSFKALRTTIKSTRSRIWDNTLKAGARNTFRALKTGDIYNEKRANSSLGMGDTSDTDFGIDDNTMSDDGWEDDDYIEQVESGRAASSESIEVAKATGESIAKTTNRAISNDGEKTREVILKQGQASTKINSSLSLMSARNNVKGFGVINDQLNQTNSFFSDVAKPFYKAGLEYYSNMIEMTQNIGKTLESIDSKLDKSNSVGSGNDYDSSSSNKENFFDRLRQRIEDSVGEDSMIMEAATKIASNPIGEVMKMVLPKMLLGDAYNSMKSLDDIIPSILPNLKKDFRGSTGILGEMVSLFFGDISRKEFKIEDKLSFDPKLRTNFDNLTRTSITEIIPTHISEIKELIKFGIQNSTGASSKKIEELTMGAQVLDVSTGFMKTQNALANELNKKIESSIGRSSMMTDIIYEIKKDVDNGKFELRGQSDADDYEKIAQRIHSYLVKNDYDVNFNVFRGEDGEINIADVMKEMRLSSVIDSKDPLKASTQVGIIKDIIGRISQLDKRKIYDYREELTYGRENLEELTYDDTNRSILRKRQTKSDELKKGVLKSFERKVRVNTLENESIFSKSINQKIPKSLNIAPNEDLLDKFGLLNTKDKLVLKTGRDLTDKRSKAILRQVRSKIKELLGVIVGDPNSESSIKAKANLTLFLSRILNIEEDEAIDIIDTNVKSLTKMKKSEEELSETKPYIGDFISALKGKSFEDVGELTEKIKARKKFDEEIREGIRQSVLMREANAVDEFSTDGIFPKKYNDLFIEEEINPNLVRPGDIKRLIKEEKIGKIEGARLIASLAARGLKDTITGGLDAKKIGDFLEGKKDALADAWNEGSTYHDRAPKVEEEKAHRDGGVIHARFPNKDAGVPEASGVLTDENTFKEIKDADGNIIKPNKKEGPGGRLLLGKLGGITSVMKDEFLLKKEAFKILGKRLLDYMNEKPREFLNKFVKKVTPGEETIKANHDSGIKADLDKLKNKTAEKVSKLKDDVSDGAEKAKWKLSDFFFGNKEKNKEGLNSKIERLIKVTKDSSKNGREKLNESLDVIKGILGASMASVIGGMSYGSNIILSKIAKIPLIGRVVPRSLLNVTKDIGKKFDEDGKKYNKLKEKFQSSAVYKMGEKGYNKLKGKAKDLWEKGKGKAEGAFEGIKDKKTSFQIDLKLIKVRKLDKKHKKLLLEAIKVSKDIKKKKKKNEDVSNEVAKRDELKAKAKEVKAEADTLWEEIKELSQGKKLPKRKSPSLPKSNLLKVGLATGGFAKGFLKAANPLTYVKGANKMINKIPGSGKLGKKMKNLAGGAFKNISKASNFIPKKTLGLITKMAGGLKVALGTVATGLSSALMVVAPYLGIAAGVAALAYGIKKGYDKYKETKEFKGAYKLLKNDQEEELKEIMSTWDEKKKKRFFSYVKKVKKQGNRSIWKDIGSLGLTSLKRNHEYLEDFKVAKKKYDEEGKEAFVKYAENWSMEKINKYRQWVKKPSKDRKKSSFLTKVGKGYKTWSTGGLNLLVGKGLEINLFRRVASLEDAGDVQQVTSIMKGWDMDKIKRYQKYKKSKFGRFLAGKYNFKNMVKDTKKGLVNLWDKAKKGFDKVKESVMGFWKLGGAIVKKMAGFLNPKNLWKNVKKMAKGTFNFFAGDLIEDSRESFGSLGEEPSKGKNNSKITELDRDGKITKVRQRHNRNSRGVVRKSTGGYIPRSDKSGTDNIILKGTGGEYVIKEDTMNNIQRNFGTGFANDLNHGNFKKVQSTLNDKLGGATFGISKKDMQGIMWKNPLLIGITSELTKQTKLLKGIYDVLLGIKNSGNGLSGESLEEAPDKLVEELGEEPEYPMDIFNPIETSNKETLEKIDLMISNDQQSILA